MNVEKIIKKKIREIPDWPKKGVNFKDITPLLQDKNAFRKIIDELARPYLGKRVDKILGIEFLIELSFLKGRGKIKNYKTRALAKY